MTETEWGVHSPWGDDAVKDYDTAHTMVNNMNAAGHEAWIIWRAVSDWQVTDDD